MSKDEKKKDNLKASIKKSIKKARKAFEKFAEAGQKAVDTTQAGLPDAAKDFNSSVLRCTNANVSELFDFADQIARAKSAEDALLLQNEFMQMQATKLYEQSNELGASLKKAFTDISNKKS